MRRLLLAMVMVFCLVAGLTQGGRAQNIAPMDTPGAPFGNTAFNGYSPLPLIDPLTGVLIGFLPFGFGTISGATGGGNATGGGLGFLLPGMFSGFDFFSQGPVTPDTVFLNQIFSAGASLPAPIPPLPMSHDMDSFAIP